MNLTIGSLFSGAGWLDLAVEEAFDASTAWHVEWDKAASKVLARHWPNVPNHHDASTTDWATVKHVDIICGGSPCQDISTAGARAGMTEGTRSNLWVAMREAIATIKPAFVVWENVEGAASATATSEMESDPGLLGDHPAGKPVLRAYGRVLGDLAALGFDAEGVSLRASDVGACHGRRRRFILAHHPGRVATLPDADNGRRREHHTGLGQFPVTDPNRDEPLIFLPTTRATDGTKGGPNQKGSKGDLMLPSAVCKLLPTVTTQDAANTGGPSQLERNSIPLNTLVTLPDQWGEYEAAIRRAEAAHGHPAPPATEPGRNGNPRLSAQFAEWMMMAEPGWITDTPGVSRNDALKIAGNGVVQNQAAAALRHMLTTIQETP